MNFTHFLHEETAEELKIKHTKQGDILTMWQLEDRLKADGMIRDDQALAFFCPVYFAGQLIVKALLDKKDEHGEVIVFSLPSISNPARIEVGLEQMRVLGIKDPEKHLKKQHGTKKLRCYSILPGIEGVASDEADDYKWIAWEAVQLSCCSIVPKSWVNEGDPYNTSYRFPGEDGYSPFWRIPTFDEFMKMRPGLAKSFKKTKEGIIKTDFTGM